MSAGSAGVRPTPAAAEACAPARAAGGRGAADARATLSEASPGISAISASVTPIPEAAETFAPARAAGRRGAADTRATLSEASPGISAISASVTPIPKAETCLLAVAKSQRRRTSRRGSAGSGRLVPLDDAQPAETARRRTIGSQYIGQARVSPGIRCFGAGLSLAYS